MAGEIQLNSTTMATESSGSITAELDTIRPNTTNGSLTLQGDSSNAGVTGLTIDSSGNATFAQTISGGTIGSSVVFPANTLHYIDSQTHTSDQTNTNDTTTYEPSNLSITIPSATVAKYSKLKISFSQALRFQSNTNTMIGVKIERSSPSVLTLQEIPYYGVQDAVTSVRNLFSGVVVDTNLGTGDHIYKIYARKETSVASGTIYLDGTDGSISWITVEGII